MKIGDDGNIIAEAHKGEIMVRCKFCSTGYVLNKEDYENDFACEKCQKLDDHIKNKDLFLTPLKKRLKYYLYLDLYEVKLEILVDSRRILIYANGDNDGGDFCFISNFENTVFGNIEIFLFVKGDYLRIKDLADFEKDLKDIL